MKLNVGELDQTIRYTLGIVLLVAGVVFESLWGLLGVLVITTALVSWCPPYVLLGIKTTKKDD